MPRWSRVNATVDAIDSLPDGLDSLSFGCLRDALLDPRRHGVYRRADSLNTLGDHRRDAARLPSVMMIPIRSVDFSPCRRAFHFGLWERSLMSRVLHPIYRFLGF